MSRRARRRLCPALQSVLDALAANVSEPCVVIVRPSNSKVRQCRIYVPAVDRALLCDVLETIDQEAEDGEPPEHASEAWLTGAEDAEKEEPGGEEAEVADVAESAAEGGGRRDSCGCTALMRAALRVLRDAGEPLTAKTVGLRLKARKGSGGPRGALRELAALRPPLARKLADGRWEAMEEGGEEGGEQETGQAGG